MKSQPKRFPERPWHRLLADQRGAVMMTMGLAIVPLFAVIGLAIDTGRGYMLRSKLSYAIDSAGLAGGRSFETDLREDDIEMFFEANFPDGYMGSSLAEGHPVVTFDDENNSIEILATATIPTRFMGVAGFHEMTITARTVIQRELQGMELVLVMDNTGSMRSGGKIDAMKDAAEQLIDILYGSRDEVENFWVALVPYAATVNIGNQYTDWLDGYDANDYDPTTWKGCVEAREYPNDSNDVIPSVEGWTAFLWESTIEQFPNPHHDADAGDYDEDDPETWGEFLNGDNQWDPDGSESALKDDNSDQNNGTGPNLGCGPAITPLVAEKSTVVAAIEEMQPWHRGGTMANLGLAWGWRVLSPAWQGLWSDSPDGLPLAYDEPNMSKVVILLTDGVNQWYDWPGSEWTEDGEDHYSGLPGSNQYPNHYDDDFEDDHPGADYTAYGRLDEGRLDGATSNSAAKTEINTRMLELCTAMRAQDIIIYTITFQVSDNATKDLYRDCATDNDHYFNSPSNGQLDNAFQQIADELSNLRIAE